MALDFPSNPTVGQKYPSPSVAGMPLYTWDGAKWTSSASSWAGSGTIASVIVSDTPPIAPDTSLWWESDTGILFFKYYDGNSSQWVIACPQPDISTFLMRAGDSMTGPLLLSGDPTAALGAVTKQYADLGRAVGQCRLVYTSTSALTLKPFDGDAIKINGVVRQIPAAGIMVNAPATPNTNYYVYASMSGTTMVLSASATAHTTSVTPGNVGVEIMSGAGGDAYSLVGYVRVNTTNQWEDSVTNRFVRSWFNDPGLEIHSGAGNVVSITGGPQEIDSSVRCNLLSWNGEQYTALGNAQSWHSGVNQIAYFGLWINGAAAGSLGLTMSQGQANSITHQAGNFVSDGLVTWALCGYTSQAGVAANYAGRSIYVTTRGR